MTIKYLIPVEYVPDEMKEQAKKEWEEFWTGFYIPATKKFSDYKDTLDKEDNNDNKI